MRHLTASCPRKTYTTNDLEYTEPVRASRRIALVWALRWEQAHGVFVLAHATQTASAPAQDVSTTGLPDDELGPLLAATTQVLGVYLGLRWFCDGAGIDADHLVGAWCPWVTEPVQAVLDRDPFLLLDEHDGDPYHSWALEIAADTEALLEAEWGGGR